MAPGRDRRAHGRGGGPARSQGRSRDADPGHAALARDERAADEHAGHRVRAPRGLAGGALRARHLSGAPLSGRPRQRGAQSHRPTRLRRGIPGERSAVAPRGRTLRDVLPAAPEGGGRGYRGGSALPRVPRGGTTGQLPRLPLHTPRVPPRENHRRALRTLPAPSPSVGARDSPHGPLRPAGRGLHRERPAASAAAPGAGRAKAVAGPGSIWPVPKPSGPIA